MSEKVYAAIDLKSFYASVECCKRGLDPLTTHLVVADSSRTDKTICLAVSPSLKQMGLPGRCRLFEIKQKIKQINEQPLKKGSHQKSYDLNELREHPEYQVDFIIAKPRMALYIQYSTQIYEIYTQYIASEDIHVYSIDEVFIDLTPYLNVYQKSAYELTKMIVESIYQQTGITATAGIGSNLYLSKIAMDIVAKHIQGDEKQMRIASLDEISYRKLLWNHQPLTDFWRIGKGIALKLEKQGLMTMGDVARCSLYHKDLLYDIFGIQAELLIDHAWGYESCQIKDIKSYHPKHHSIGSGQVLTQPYTFEQAKLIVKEMSELLSLDLVDKGLVSDCFVLHIGYDVVNLDHSFYEGKIQKDSYGRSIPAPAHGTIRLSYKTSSYQKIMNAFVNLYERIVDPNLQIRRVNLSACEVVSELFEEQKIQMSQMNLFEDFEVQEYNRKKEIEELKKEKDIQRTILMIKKKYGKNGIMKAMNLQKEATTLSRNEQIGGHKA